jgi:hypothetical protein
VTTALCPAAYQKVLGTQRQSSMVFLSFTFLGNSKELLYLLAGPTGVRAAKGTTTPTDKLDAEEMKPNGSS